MCVGAHHQPQQVVAPQGPESQVECLGQEWGAREGSAYSPAPKGRVPSRRGQSDAYPQTGSCFHTARPFLAVARLLRIRACPEKTWLPPPSMLAITATCPSLFSPHLTVLPSPCCCSPLRDLATRALLCPHSLECTLLAPQQSLLAMVTHMFQEEGRLGMLFTKKRGECRRQLRRSPVLSRVGARLPSTRAA